MRWPLLLLALTVGCGRDRTVELEERLAEASAREAEQRQTREELVTTCRELADETHRARLDAARLAGELAKARGRVDELDDKLGLVVIDAGRQKGVKKGYAFIVFRKDECVGKIIVDEVFRDVSAAHFEPAVGPDEPQVGDEVTTQLAVDF
ncbi:MAG: hypothetical protein ACODAJ_17115 [Planctomycetota bacterium]